MISIADVEHVYREGRDAHTALRGVSVEVAAGQFLALLGPSGCGKTTLLRCIAGLAEPERGTIRIGDETVFSASEHVSVPARLRDIGMVFQSYAIWPHMSVAENAAFPLRYRCPELKAAEIRERTADVLRLVHLDELADRPAPALSGGQQQRLALARALIAQPKVLLLDEPLSNLDARLREEMRFELRALTKRLGVTTILVTHGQAEALSLADVVAVMNDGEFVQISTPHELYDRPHTEFVARFVGRANLVPAQVLAAGVEPSPRHVTVSTPYGNVECVSEIARSAGDRATLAVPPEAFVLRPAGGAGEDGATGTVEGVAFLGDATEVVVRVADAALITKLPAADAPAVGSRVTAVIASRNCMLLN
ncbi:MAG TPA: ABC transporter ATP-binding protein [Candidatus Lustribacter sp.]|jgi:iron(III) transport system ATP-binding protein|nr:ABC transporter ATP-binding protein [Candidatus Lustribacter sp.]